MDDATLLTPALRLRLLDADDAGHAALYRRLYMCPQVMAEIGEPLTAAAADTAFGRVCHHNARDAPGHRAWAVSGRESEDGLGLVVLYRRGDRAELGLMLRPEAWTGRVSNEALAPVIDYGFAAMGLETVDAGCRDGRNTRVSRRLLAPFAFIPSPDPRPGFAEWLLPRARWLARPGARSVASRDPPG
jgi:RimJ/RimL family protein N-acetyltransferase